MQVAGAVDPADGAGVVGGVEKLGHQRGQQTVGPTTLLY